jgi:hypothetical protein
MQKEKCFLPKKRRNFFKEFYVGTTVKFLSESYDDMDLNDLWHKQTSSANCMPIATQRMTWKLKRYCKQVKVLQMVSFPLQWRKDRHDMTFPGLLNRQKYSTKKLKLPHKCDFSLGWLHKFKTNHVISLYNLSDKQLSADRSSWKLSARGICTLKSKQVYNVDETAMFWVCTPKSTLCTAGKLYSGMIQSQERSH